MLHQMDADHHKPLTTPVVAEQQQRTQRDDMEQMLQYYKRLVEHKDQDIASLEKHVSEKQKLSIALQAANNASSAASLACTQKERQLEAEMAARKNDAEAAAHHAAKVCW